MKLVIIYGPPAAGKLTVGQQLAKQTGFSLFHNHLTIDLAREIYPKNCPEREELVNHLRIDVFESAAKANIDLIFTVVYASPIDDEWYAQRATAVEKHGGEVCFVQLVPSKVELSNRVIGESRASTSKIKDNDTLLNVLGKYDLYSPVKHRNNLTIDNTEIKPSEVVEQIIEHYNLKPIAQE